MMMMMMICQILTWLFECTYIVARSARVNSRLMNDERVTSLELLESETGCRNAQLLTDE